MVGLEVGVVLDVSVVVVYCLGDLGFFVGVVDWLGCDVGDFEVGWVGDDGCFGCV